MKINGLQKLTLLDFPNRTACTVFTPRCNLRCPFCHNADLVFGRLENELISEEEFFAFLNKRKGTLDGVCITGGEPLLQTDIADFIRKIRSAGFLVKLDTNGFFYTRLENLINEGLLDYIAMDIKNTAEKYPATVGIDKADTEAVQKSISLIMNSGIDYEFRTTAVAELHTPEDFTGIGKMIQGAKRYFIQNFVDSGGTIEKGLTALPADELKRCAENAAPYVEHVGLRGV